MSEKDKHTKLAEEIFTRFVGRIPSVELIEGTCYYGTGKEKFLDAVDCAAKVAFDCATRFFAEKQERAGDK